MAKFDASNIKEKTNYLVAYDLMKGRDELKSLVDKIRQVESVIDIERTRG